MADGGRTLRGMATAEAPRTIAPAATVWLTGLSGAGKSTIGRRLVDVLHGQGRPAVLLDGDEIREHLTRGLGFSREDRDEQVRRVGWLCGLLNANGVIAVAALVSPFRDARATLRRELPRFVEVHVDAPLEVLEARDPKGLYRRSRQGDLHGLTGVGAGSDATYEPPTEPEVRCVTDGTASPDACVERILAALARFDQV